MTTNLEVTVKIIAVFHILYIDSWKWLTNRYEYIRKVSAPIPYTSISIKASLIKNT